MSSADARGFSRRILADELLLLGREGARRALVRARLGAQGLEAALLVAPVPALERRDRERARRVGARRSEPLLAEQREASGELAAREIEARERADDLAAEQGHGFGVVLRREGIHGSNLSAPPFVDGVVGLLRAHRGVAAGSRMAGATASADRDRRGR